MTAPQFTIIPVEADRLTLGDVLIALDRVAGLSDSRRRDLKSCVKGIARLCGDVPGAIVLDFEAIRSRLETVSPIAHKISPKRLANMKWGFAYAVRATGLLPVQMGRSKVRLSPVWKSFMEQLTDRRSTIGLGRLAHFASSRGLDPSGVDDSVVDALMEHVDKTSLRRNQQRLRRTTTIVWNDIAARSPELGLQRLVVPAWRQKLTRIKSGSLPASFNQDEKAYVDWCAGVDPFAADARAKRLAPGTLTTLRGYINAAATSLVDSGVDRDSLKGLADLVSPDSVGRILRVRHAAAGGRDDTYTFNVGLTLMSVAREWVKVGAEAVAQLRRMVMKVRPRSLGTMTERNQKFVRQFDDPAVADRLRDTPARLWREVMAEARPTWRTLARAQGALALAILTYMPIRLQNLVALAFDVDVFLMAGAGATSTLELPGVKVKNNQPIAFDIPPHIVRMLNSYRDDFAPSVLGHRPVHVFVNMDGSRKGDKALRYLIQTYMKRYVGVDFNPHTFRHLGAAVILKAHPGGHSIVKDLLGHKSLNTSIKHYIGIRTREAGLHMQRLLDDPAPTVARRRPRRPDRDRRRGGKR